MTTVTPPRPTAGHGLLRRQAAGLAAVPLVLGALLAAHPLLRFDPFVLDGRLGRWFAVHYGLLLALPALGGVAWLMLRGFTGPLALAARGGILVYVAFAAAYDALAGIGTGLLLQSTLALDADALAAVAPVVTQWWVALNPHWIAAVSQAAWAVFAVGAALLHRRRAAHPAVVWGLAVGGLYALAHGSVPATMTLAAFAIAVYVHHRRPPTAGR